MIHVATKQLLSREKFRHVTTTRIAERAGVSVGTLYQYYSDRNSVIRAVFQEYLAGIVSDLKRVCDEARGLALEPMVRTIVEGLLSCKATYPHLTKALFSNDANFPGSAGRCIFPRGRTGHFLP